MNRAWIFISRLCFSELLVPLIVLVLSSVFLFESYRVPVMRLFGWGPMLFPRWICVGAFIIASLNLIKAFFSAVEQKNGSESDISGSQLLFLMVLAVSIFLLPVWGYRPVLSAFLFVSSIMAGVRGWKISVALIWSLFLSGSSWWLFSDVLKVFLP